MTEDRGDGKDEQVTETDGLSRRQFWPIVGRRIAGAVGAAVVVKDFDPDSIKSSIEYIIAPNGLVRVILGRHIIDPRERSEVWSSYAEGDLTVSDWSPAALAKVDQSMRKAKKEGRPYFLCIDGVDASNNGFNLPLPFPADLYSPNQYPKNMYIVGADILDDYGLNSLAHTIADDESWNAVHNLYLDIRDRYHLPTTRQEIIDVIKQESSRVGFNKLNESILGVILLAAGFKLDSSETRRKVLKVIGILAGISGVELYKISSQANIGSLIAGELSDKEEQDIAVALGNVTNWTLGNKAVFLRTNARTAIAVEKAVELSENPPPQISKQPIEIDLLYGLFHGGNLPKIVRDQGYRYDSTRDFLRDLLGFAGSRIKNNYPVLNNYRDAALKAIARSILPYEIVKFNVPWNRQSILPGMYTDLIRTQFSGSSQSLETVATNVLSEFGVEG